LLAFLIVNLEFHIYVTAKANARKIMVMMHVIGNAKESQQTFRIQYKAAVRVCKADYKQAGP